MPKIGFTCRTCRMYFEHVAAIIHLEDGTVLLVCPYCEAKYEVLPSGATPNQGVHPEGIV